MEKNTHIEKKVSQNDSSGTKSYLYIDKFGVVNSTTKKYFIKE